MLTDNEFSIKKNWIPAYAGKTRIWIPNQVWNDEIRIPVDFWNIVKTGFHTRLGYRKKLDSCLRRNDGI
jgi:hypothetical protein